ncbi:MAG: hypothetical protein IPF54_05425 [Draconibacterium sp.]|nr:hypothetical protein [Draconibacterium sp.]
MEQEILSEIKALKKLLSKIVGTSDLAKQQFSRGNSQSQGISKIIN